MRFRQPAHSRKPVPILNIPLPAITLDCDGSIAVVKVLIDDDAAADIVDDNCDCDDDVIEGDAGIAVVVDAATEATTFADVAVTDNGNACNDCGLLCCMCWEDVGIGCGPDCTIPQLIPIFVGPHDMS